MLITSEQHLRLVLDQYIDHYHGHGHTARSSRTRPPGTRIHLLQARIAGYFDGIGPAA